MGLGRTAVKGLEKIVKSVIGYQGKDVHIMVFLIVNGYESCTVKKAVKIKH